MIKQQLQVTNFSACQGRSQAGSSVTSNTQVIQLADRGQRFFFLSSFDLVYGVATAPINAGY